MLGRCKGVHRCVVFTLPAYSTSLILVAVSLRVSPTGITPLSASSQGYMLSSGDASFTLYASHRCVPACTGISEFHIARTHRCTCTPSRLPGPLSGFFCLQIASSASLLRLVPARNPSPNDCKVRAWVVLVGLSASSITSRPDISPGQVDYEMQCTTRDVVKHLFIDSSIRSLPPELRNINIESCGRYSQFHVPLQLATSTATVFTHLRVETRPLRLVPAANRCQVCCLSRRPDNLCRYKSERRHCLSQSDTGHMNFFQTIQYHSSIRMRVVKDIRTGIVHIMYRQADTDKT